MARQRKFRSRGFCTSSHARLAAQANLVWMVTFILGVIMERGVREVIELTKKPKSTGGPGPAQRGFELYVDLEKETTLTAD